MIEQARQVGRELRGSIRRRKSPAPPISTQVGNDHAMSARKMPDDRLEHLAGDHQPMHEQERRSRSSLGEVEKVRGSHVCSLSLGVTLMRATVVHVAALALFTGLVAGQPPTAKTLDLYLIDVEGGNAQLYRLPSGESVLIDSGNGGPAAVRDAARIMAAVKDAGLHQIDHLITTHF